ncbi:response regulator transcription factor [Synechococcus sp. PCC 7502]|uniref:response regulator transcription factor n=1 Tax=Synechococcus sp. PCC 7502 TaxID=1173263 RepID=UPI00059E8A14|nr:response regulator transcription factor [Synechococcus sp. PCC 7502]
MGTKTLIVEDEKLVAQHISQLLKDEDGSICEIASDGNTAIKKIADFQPKLILLDIRLKGEMDGIEVGEHIQSLYDIPFLYLTAFSDRETIERAKHTYPAGYILKPFRREQLTSAIKIAMSTHSAQKNAQINKLALEHDSSPAEKVLANYRLKPILDYINKHFDHEINLETLADLINMNPSYFCRFFNQEVGCSPYQYIIQTRIEKAKILLKQKDLFINDICFQCGFTSHSQFNRHFRRFVGMTPKEFRDL